MNFIGTGYTKGAETYKLVGDAIRNGYYNFDCAMIYGNQYEVGSAIMDSKVDRSQLLLLSKCSFKCRTKEDVFSEFNKTLEDLQTNYLDIYLCHWPNGYERNALVWEALEELKKSGKVKHIGVSNFQIHHFIELFKTAKVLPEYNQVEIHPFLQQFQLNEYCLKYGIQLMGFGTLAKGMVFEDENLTVISTELGISVPKLVNSWLYSRNIDAIIRPMEDSHFEELKILANISTKYIDRIKMSNTGNRLYSDPDNMIFDR